MAKKMKKNYLYLVEMLLLYFVFWVAVSGSLNLQQLLAGAAVSLFVAYLNIGNLDSAALRTPFKIKGCRRFFSFGTGLLLEIIKANFMVAWIVLHRRMPLSPQMVWIKADLQREGSRVLLANSITLTPGTLTVLAEEDRFLVHALTEQNAADLQRWSLTELLQNVEGENR